ncbi:MAG: ribosomal L7Ae/L30e/S12e/Gadd45 family protein [Nanoarchaeales archaeon]|nr:ribosomal L7Ae/L30e/S12e/Gadd45 family protein [Nanoarchaeales archaeon]
MIQLKMVEIDEKQVFAIIAKAKESGSIKIGVNEVTKAIERGQAKLVVAANDVSPAEIIAHLEGLSSEMKAVYAAAGSKAELGAAVGLKTTTAIAVTDAGAAKKDLEALVASMAEEKTEEVKTEEVAEEVAEEVKTEEKTEEKSE